MPSRRAQGRCQRQKPLLTEAEFAESMKAFFTCLLAWSACRAIISRVGLHFGLPFGAEGFHAFREFGFVRSGFCPLTTALSPAATASGFISIPQFVTVWPMFIPRA